MVVDWWGSQPCRWWWSKPWRDFPLQPKSQLLTGAFRPCIQMYMSLISFSNLTCHLDTCTRTASLILYPPSSILSVFFIICLHLNSLPSSEWPSQTTLVKGYPHPNTLYQATLFHLHHSMCLFHLLVSYLQTFWFLEGGLSWTGSMLCNRKIMWTTNAI